MDEITIIVDLEKLHAAQPRGPGGSLDGVLALLAFPYFDFTTRRIGTVLSICGYPLSPIVIDPYEAPYKTILDDTTRSITYTLVKLGRLVMEAFDRLRIPGYYIGWVKNTEGKIIQYEDGDMVLAIFRRPTLRDALPELSAEAQAIIAQIAAIISDDLLDSFAYNDMVPAIGIDAALQVAANFIRGQTVNMPSVEDAAQSVMLMPCETRQRFCQYLQDGGIATPGIISGFDYPTYFAAIRARVRQLEGGE